ncbi:MAG: sulfatase [Bacteroidales bacterium]
MKKLIFLSLLLAALTAGAQDKPNIIIFFVDDMGWQETSLPLYKEATHNNNYFQTPNMERLASKGLTYTNAYAAPLCSPTRISLMTGVNAMKHQVTNWTLNKDISPDEKAKNDFVTPPEWNVNGMSCEKGINNTFYADQTLPSILNKAGYKTIHVGKAHFGAIGTPASDPINIGFDVNIGGHAAGGPGSYYGTNNFSAAHRNGGNVWDVPGLEEFHGKDIYLTEALTLKATEEMKKSVAEDQAFFLYLSHYAVHAPFEADKRFLDKYKAYDTTKLQQTNGSMIESMDKSLGDIMQQVKLLGIEDNTVIIFMSDNGQPPSIGEQYPLRGYKIQAYEGGIRVPLIVYDPHGTAHGTRTDKNVIIDDILPTVAEFAHATSNIDHPQELDGVSIVNPDKVDGERILFWHYPHIYYSSPYSIVRKGDWKLIYFYDKEKAELYNTKTDISEKNDLSDTNKAKFAELSQILRKQLLDTKAPIPISKKTGKPCKLP